MKNIAKATTRITAGIAVTILAVMANAFGATWTQPAGGSWSTPGNWDSGVPNSPGAVATVTNVSLATTVVTNDLMGLTLGTLQIGGPDAVTTISLTNEAPEYNLVFDNGGNGARLQQFAPYNGTDKIYTPILLNEDLTLTNLATRYVQIYGAITENGSPRKLIKTGTGYLTLSSTANTFSGGIDLKSGLLSAYGNRAGYGPITVGDPAVTDAAQLVGGSGNITNAITISAGSAQKTLRAAGSGAAVVFTGPMLLDGDVEFNSGTGTKSTTVSGVISGTGSVKTTGGAITNFVELTAANTFSGGVTLGSRILRLGSSYALGTGPLTIFTNTILSGNSSSARSITNSVFLNGNVTLGQPSGGTGPLTISGPVSIVGDVDRTVTIANSTTQTISGIISGDAGVTKAASSGTLVLRGQNTFKGPLTVKTGNLNANPTSGFDPLGAAPVVPTTNLLVLDGGTLTISRAFFVHGNRGVYITENNGIVGGSAACGFSGVVDGPGTLIKSNANRLSLGGANTFSGGLILADGKLRPGHDMALGTGPLTVSNGVSIVNYYATVRTLTNAVAVYGDFTLGSLASDEFGTLNFAGPWEIGDVTRMITVPDDGAGSNVVSVISGPIAGNGGGILKVGQGTLVLSGANSYSGTTTVQEGELTLSTAASTPGAIAAIDGTTLGIVRDPSKATLTAPSLSLGNWAGVTVAFYLPTGTSASPVVDVGTLAVAEGGTINVQIFGGNFTAGTQFPLIKYSVYSGSGSFATVPVRLPAGVVGEIVNTGSSIDLKITSVSSSALTWKASVNNLWDLSSGNWNDGADGATFVQGSSVTLDDNANGLVPGTLTLTGVMQPSAVTVNNNALAYTINGAGSLSGGMTLTKVGTNMLTIASQNTYSGGTVVNEGTLRVFNLAGSATGSGAVTVNTGASLLGNGFIAGPVVIGGGANVALGTAALGTLTVNNTLNLASGSSTFLRLDKSLNTNDVIAAGATTFGGTLTVTNLSGELTGGETFKLFSTTGESANFASVVVLGSTATAQFDPATGLLTIEGGMASYPTNMSVSFNNGSLSLAWPETHKGWYAQSNAVDVANSAEWFDVPGSESGTSLSITVDPASPKVFYRLRKP